MQLDKAIESARLCQLRTGNVVLVVVRSPAYVPDHDYSYCDMNSANESIPGWNTVGVFLQDGTYLEKEV